MLMKELRYLDHLWYRLGRLLLEEPHFELEIIEANHRGSAKRSLIEVLQLRLKRSPQPTWKTIVEALKDPIVGRHRLAAEIEAKYCHSL